ncbi:MAG: transposase [Saprospiraceae bacterium]|nr:transposase [Saprospiraceae bacterium]
MKKSSKPSSELRSRRIFSETFKRQKVKEIEQGLYTVLELSRLYSVSTKSVYRWLHKYSITHQKGVVQVVQMQSESHKNKQLLARLAELERIVGQKQLQMDYLEQLIRISSEELKVDLKKNFDTQSWPTSTDLSSQKGSK